MSGKLLRVTIAGWKQCHFYQKASTVGASLKLLFPTKVEVQKIELEDRDAYQKWLSQEKSKLNLTGTHDKHTSSPFVFLNDEQYLGGCDAFIDFTRRKVAFDDTAQSEVTVNDGVKVLDSAYDYDVVTIGGGSGGLAFAKEAAGLGARAAVLDFVKPSSHGTTWGLGGTCVNVGCIPKKLYHRAALLGEQMHEAKGFGWTVTSAKNDWATLSNNIKNYIKGLNFKTRVDLRDNHVTYMNSLGHILDNHTVQLTDRTGKVSKVTAGRIVVAVGGRPTRLECPGGEHAIDSDDLFQMDWIDENGSPRSPGKVLVVGASYVALEGAGFFTGLGYDTTVMVRSILLRGFDREYADKIGEYMEDGGTKFIYQATPTMVEKLSNGKFKVTYTQSNNGHNSSVSDVFDTVVCAIGRNPDTSRLGLDAVKVQTNKKGEIVCVNEQTSVPNIYALGDVVQGVPELTPVAIQSGKQLARRLFGTSKEAFNYDLVPTTVFTPIEYGTVGLSEEVAIQRYGSTALEVYHREVLPLEWQLCDKPKGIARLKLICLKTEGMKVVGLHYLGPDAGEVTQGFATALKKQATYFDIISTVGIHPTKAEDFTTVKITKSSGKDASAANC